MEVSTETRLINVILYHVVTFKVLLFSPSRCSYTMQQMRSSLIDYIKSNTSFRSHRRRWCFLNLHPGHFNTTHHYHSMVTAVKSHCLRYKPPSLIMPLSGATKHPISKTYTVTLAGAQWCYNIRISLLYVALTPIPGVQWCY